MDWREVRFARLAVRELPLQLFRLNMAIVPEENRLLGRLCKLDNRLSILNKMFPVPKLRFDRLHMVLVVMACMADLALDSFLASASDSFLELALRSSLVLAFETAGH